jgi:hypothetical protein
MDTFRSSSDGPERDLHATRRRTIARLRLPSSRPRAFFGKGTCYQTLSKSMASMNKAKYVAGALADQATVL